MADHTANALSAMIRSMNEVVLPAVDAEHPLALEQAGLVVQYLEFLSRRLDYLAAKGQFELDHYARLADVLLPTAGEVSPPMAAAMSEALRAEREVRRRSAAPPSELHRRAQRLAMLVSALVRTAEDGPAEARATIARHVLAASEELTMMQRSWFAPQGWEPESSDLRSVEAALGIEHEHGGVLR